MALARSHSLRPVLALVSRSSARSYATPSVVNSGLDPQIPDYPNVPSVNRQNLSPYGWSDPLERRNFNEPLHPQAELLSMWGPDVPPLPPKTALYRFSLALLTFVGFGYVTMKTLVPENPAARRVYPYSGLVTELGGVEQNKAREESIAEEED